MLIGLTIFPAACGWRTPATSVAPATVPEDAGPAIFRDITAASGISFAYRNGAEADHLSILESLGGGVALLDFDGDGLLDLFLPGGGPSRARTFTASLASSIATSATSSSRMPAIGCNRRIGWFYTHGAAVGDYDRDGWPDLLLTGWDRLALFHNEPVDPKDSSKGRTRRCERKAGLPVACGAAAPAGPTSTATAIPIFTSAITSIGPSPIIRAAAGRADMCPPKNFRRAAAPAVSQQSATASSPTSAGRPVCGPAARRQQGTGRACWWTSTATASRTSTSPTIPPIASCTSIAARRGVSASRSAAWPAARPATSGLAQRQHGRRCRRLRPQRQAVAVRHQLRKRTARSLP